MARKKRESNSRPARWGRAVAKALAAKEMLEEGLEELKELQSEYQDWEDNLPDNLQGSALADKLQGITALDFEIDLSAIEEAEGIDLPLGFGRD